jgi:uncharacterized protein YecE (DUF72 family)
MARFWIGTSGYGYKEWRGPFYPAEIAEPEMLKFYSERLSSVELNYTFYRTPTVRTVQAWGKETPEHFTFSLKAPRRITHDLRLRDTGDLLGYFVDTSKVLKHRLGVALFQLPPFLKKDLSRLEDFLHQVPPGYRAAFEFRNATWFSDDVYECLRRFNIAMCISDREERSAPFEATADYGYFRLRRPDYTEAELTDWAQRLADASDWQDTFVYFKQEQEGRGAALALRLQQLLQPEREAAAG